MRKIAERIDELLNSAILNGVIETNSGSGTYFPGTVAGATFTGGQYF